MLAFQREIGDAVIEVGDIPRTIMACQAIIPESLPVFEHELGIMIRVAILAGIAIEIKAASLAVAAFTRHGCQIIIHLVPGQGKAGWFVIEKGKSCRSGIKIPSSMIWMACPALSDLFHPGMGTALLHNLLHDVRVAAQA